MRWVQISSSSDELNGLVDRFMAVRWTKQDHASVKLKNFLEAMKQVYAPWTSQCQQSKPTASCQQPVLTVNMIDGCKSATVLAAFNATQQSIQQPIQQSVPAALAVLEKLGASN